MKTHQNFEEIIICPGLMVLTRTQCTQFTSPPSWRGRQLFRWLNCVLFSLINDYTLFIFLPQITSEVENKILMIYQTTHDWAAARKCQRIYFYPSFQGKHEYQARQEAENEETAKSWHSAFNGIYFSFSQHLGPAPHPSPDRKFESHIVVSLLQWSLKAGWKQG